MPSVPPHNSRVHPPTEAPVPSSRYIPTALFFDLSALPCLLYSRPRDYLLDVGRLLETDQAVRSSMIGCCRLPSLRLSMHFGRVVPLAVHLFLLARQEIVSSPAGHQILRVLLRCRRLFRRRRRSRADAPQHVLPGLLQ